MFPPHWITAPITKSAAPRFNLPAAAPPADYSVFEMPPGDTTRTGIIPFSGHKLPLPAGSWQELTLLKDGGAAGTQVELLARVENQHLTGLEMAAAPSPLSNTIGGFAGTGPCNATNAIVADTIPVTGNNPLARECWALFETAMDGDDARIKTDPVMHRGLDRLKQMGVQVPDHMMVLSYMRSDETGWMTAFLFLPGRPAEPGHRLVNWVRRFAPLLHKGYLSSLTPAELAAVGHDPA